MASTSFGVLITGDSRGAVKAIDLTSEEIKKLEGATTKATAKIKSDSASAASGFGDMATSAAKMGAAVIGAGVALSGLLLRQVIKETAESEYAIAQLNSTLQATGGAAGKSSEELQRTATALQGVTTYSDEAVIGVQSMLLKFKSVSGDTFDRATKSVLDMATAMGTDANSAAKLLGKALEDPEKGMLQLARAGVVLSESEKETVRAMVEMGDAAGAQNFILAEMEERFKGSAEAARGTLGGAIEGLKNQFGELFEVSAEASGGMVNNINALSATLADPQIKDSINDIVAGLIAATDWAVKFAAAMNWAFGSGGKRNLVDISDDIDRATKSLNDATSGRTIDPVAAEALRKELEKLNAEYQKEVDAINNSKKAKDAAAVSTTALTKAVSSSNNVVSISEAALKKEAETTKKAADEKANYQGRIDKATKSIEASNLAIDAMNAKTEDYIASLKFETEQLGKSERQQEIDNAVREAGTAITQKQAEAIREAAGAHYDAAAAAAESTRQQEESAAQQEQMWSHLTDSMSDIFTAMVVDGKSSMDSLSDGFSAMIKKMLAEAAFNEIVIGFGGTAANGQNSTNSSFAGRIGNAAATYGISELLSAGFTAFTGSEEDIKNADALTQGINALADASWKPVEWLTGKSFSDVFGQDNDGNNTASAAFDLATGSITGTTWGKTGGDVAAAEALAQPLLQIATAAEKSSNSPVAPSKDSNRVFSPSSKSVALSITSRIAAS